MAKKNGNGNVTLLKKRTSSAPVYEPGQRYRWVEFLEGDAQEGDPPVRVRIRTSLTAAELEVFEFEGDTHVSTLYPLVAPHIVEWNVVTRGEDGELYDVAPPATGGVESFEYLPYSLFWAIFRAIRATVYRTLDPKSPATLVAMEGQASAAS